MKKILIANRGEIAIRIARSVSDLGMIPVGIYSEDDGNSLHLTKMNENHKLSGKGVSAYLDIKEIVSISKEHNIDAIHPGYGFLSENQNFAKNVRKEGLIFIGPDEKTLKSLGKKSLARDLAEKLGIPVIKGTNKKTSLEESKKFFKSLKKNSQVMLKAVHGGGGRGMRRVSSLKDLEEAFDRASSEAKNSFGNSSLYIEECLKNYRHIEVQIIGDGKGSISHLWERECSVQRRHQKILEIAPSPSISDLLREEIIDAALRIGRSLNYSGLGTIEFLVNPDKEDFRFLEGNARLQVEHTVTEEILNLDLVSSQIKISQGKTLKQLKLDQDNIPKPSGFAIQSRVNMETIDNQGNTKPTGGTFNRFDLPSGPGVRVDTYGYLSLIHI